MKRKPPRYRLQDLLDQISPNSPVLPVIKEWESMVPVGKEIVDPVIRIPLEDLDTPVDAEKRGKRKLVAKSKTLQTNKSR